MRRTTLAATVMLATALLATTVPASAADKYPYDVGNSILSPYAINVYTDSYCKKGRRVLNPGWYSDIPNSRSTRVNAYSRVKRPGRPYSSLIKPNVCVKINDKGLTWVRNYPND